MSTSIEHYPLILLAGGKSSRMGRPKGLLDFRGEPWLIRQLRAFVRAGGRRIILVLGFEAQAYQPILAHLDLGSEVECRVTVNPAPERGSFSSLQHGAIALLAEPSLEAAWISPIDVPLPAPETWAKIQHEFRDAEVAIPAW